MRITQPLVLGLTLFGATAAHAQLALPHNATEIMLSPGGDALFTMDLGTVSERPVLVMEVVPDAAHPDMEIQIELNNFVGAGCGGFPDPVIEGSASAFSDPGTGSKTLEFSLIGCNPVASQWLGVTADVRVRALALGNAGAPAFVDVTLKSRTLPPFNEIFAAPMLTPQVVTIEDAADFRDTTLYEDDDKTSNGAGSFLWAANNPLQPVDRRTLIAVDLSAKVPSDATVDAVVLLLTANTVLGSGVDVDLFEVSHDPLNPWPEGSANASGNEFNGDFSATPAATWTYRELGPTSLPWSSPGGDFLSPVLASFAVSIPGPYFFTGPALAAAVQNMLVSGEDGDGFLLAAASPALTTAGVQFLSSEGSFSDGPKMIIDFTPGSPWNSGEFSPNVEDFINEGEDLRWIYDTDNDDIYVTPISGICEVDFDPETPTLVPYTYQYNGTPFTGHDCCTWQIDSQQTGLVGTGQAIFFHNLDPTNPSHIPPDSDLDGIRNLCDNCPARPNGPLLGTCVGGSSEGSICQNDGECGLGNCHQSQEDADKDFVGDVCLLPEPGFALALASGALLLCALARRRAVL